MSTHGWFALACAFVACGGSAPAPVSPPSPEAAPASPASPVPMRFTMQLQRDGQDQGALRTKLAEQAKIAQAQGRVPFVYLWLHVCSHCTALDNAYEDARLVEAMRGTYIIRVSVDDWHEEIVDNYFDASDDIRVPSFWRVYDDGRVEGTISGGAWDEDTPANMAPPLQKFFRSHGVPLAFDAPVDSQHIPDPFVPPSEPEGESALGKAPAGLPDNAVLDKVENGLEIYRVPAGAGTSPEAP